MRSVEPRAVVVDLHVDGMFQSSADTRLEESKKLDKRMERICRDFKRGVTLRRPPQRYIYSSRAQEEQHSELQVTAAGPTHASGASDVEYKREITSPHIRWSCFCSQEDFPP